MIGDQLSQGVVTLARDLLEPGCRAGMQAAPLRSRQRLIGDFTDEDVPKGDHPGA